MIIVVVVVVVVVVVGVVVVVVVVVGAKVIIRMFDAAADVDDESFLPAAFVVQPEGCPDRGRGEGRGAVVVVTVTVTVTVTVVTFEGREGGQEREGRGAADGVEGPRCGGTVDREEVTIDGEAQRGEGGGGGIMRRKG